MIEVLREDRFLREDRCILREDRCFEGGQVFEVLSMCLSLI